MESNNALCLSVYANGRFVGGACAIISEHLFEASSECNILFQYIDPGYRFGLIPVTMLNEAVREWAQSRQVDNIKAASYAGVEGDRLMRRLGFVPYQNIYTRSV